MRRKSFLHGFTTGSSLRPNLDRIYQDICKIYSLGLSSHSLVDVPVLNHIYQLRHLNDALTSEVRRLMLAELDWSLERGKLYYSKHFSEAGQKEYPLLLEKALRSGNPDTLEESLNVPAYFQPGAPRNAAQTFAWDEFNKYYMRSLCRLAQVQKGDLLVARGRHSEKPKPESTRLIGSKRDPSRFLNGLREIPKVNPFGANSGLTLELSQRAEAS